MFGLAKQIVNHKVGVIAVIAFAVFVFSGDDAEDAKNAGSASPWSKQTVAVAKESSEDSLVGSTVDSAVAAAGDLFEEHVGINPIEAGSKTVGRFDDINDAYAKANEGN